MDDGREKERVCGVRMREGEKMSRGEVGQGQSEHGRHSEAEMKRTGRKGLLLSWSEGLALAAVRPAGGAAGVDSTG